MTFNPTEAQKRIYDFIESGRGNGIIDAVAGAGKTTTLIGCVSHIPNINDVIYCAFNTSIRKELQRKFKEANQNVKVSTIHALGFQMLRATKNFHLDDYKYNHIIKDPQFFDTLIPEIDKILSFHSHPTIAELRQLEERRDILDWNEKNDLNEGQQYVGKIIRRLLDINQKYRCTLEEDDVKCYEAMIRHFGIIPYYEQCMSNYSDEIAAYFTLHQKLIKEGNSMAISHGIIDFTDQIYLPFIMNLTAQKKYGFVFVDECQDLSKAQVKIVEKYLREDGRLLAVGDPYQAIYGFAGADCNSFQRVTDSFNCTVLGLTDCFRCPQDIIRLTQSLRSDIKGFKDYSGKIYKIPNREVLINIKEGDLVICRTRLPLRALAIKLINKDFKVKIHPDELLEFMGDYKKNFTPQELRIVLNDDIIDQFFEYAKERNRKRITRENQNTDAIIRKILIKEEVDSMVETLDFLKKKYFDWHLNTLDNILKRLKLMLSNPSDDAIRISTIHRAKGLENDRVFILEYDKLPPPRELEWENIQERNLHYVAVTRSKEELYLCDSQLVTDSEEPDENAQPATPINVLDVLSTNAILPTAVETSIIDKINGENTPNRLKDNGYYLEMESADNPFVNNANNNEDEETKAFLDSLSSIAPSVTYAPITFRPIQVIKKVPEKFYAFDEQDTTPYEKLTAPCQKAKYWAVYNNLQDTEFSIHNIVSSQYLDVYYLNTPNGIEIYNGYYNKGGQYRFTPMGKCINAEQVMRYLEDESSYRIKYDYNPMSDGFDAVHQLIQAECQELNVCNTNIYSESYAMVYCLKTSTSHAYLKFSYNGRKIITTIAPFSTEGDNDTQLKSIIESLKHLWQR